ncbi:Zinc-binding dehydrogenase [Geosmithia morbida]|uniref:Zinc-binding dehydrogenase n=1 Tax=Geosmithia morbida TaxID=1094350 RepID=A0A9P4Z3I2_9HYPO|nr:Zinc-binding dehydrogenase [Geosmithia morbida]KAF4126568.1 Zinc-binding dehydrogenase [Geosmithia morbida]
MSRVLHLKQVPGKPGEVYYPLQIRKVPIPQPGQGQVLVRMSAAALNHRDLFIRHHQYPAISFDDAMLADGSGTVASVGPGTTRGWKEGQAVILTPMRGWESDAAGPEGGGQAFSVTGSSRLTPVGTAQDYVVVDEAEVEASPPHLSAAEAAALPLVGLTGWRALVTKAGEAAVSSPGRNVLVTGIGGGVALQVLQLAVAMGAKVYVTSGDAGKIDRAAAMGASGGVLYREKGWDGKLRAMLPAGRPFLDAVIDGAGGDIVGRAARLLRPGGVIAQYGMTAGPKMDWSMGAVLANIDLKGTTMGSRREFRDMVAFVTEHGIRPIVSRVVAGLDNLPAIDGLFDDMERGKQRLLALLGRPVASLLGGHKLCLALLVLVGLLDLLLLHALVLGGPVLCALGEEVLAGLDLDVELALLGGGGEGGVDLLGLVRDIEGLAAVAERLPAEVGEEAIPALVGEVGVLCELPLDHELLDVVDGVDVCHAVLDDAAYLLEALVGPHGRDGVAVDEDVGLGQELEGLEGRAVGAQDALSALDEALLAVDQVADLDDVARHAVVQDLDGLRGRHAALIRSRAFRIAAGSNVLRVVLTVMLPSTRSSVQAMPCFSSDLVTSGHASFRYTSRYLGNRVANDDSSANVPPTLSFGVNASTFHLSMSPVSHGFSFLCVDGIVMCVRDGGGGGGGGCYST